MFLAALALVSNAAVQTAVVRPPTAPSAPQNLLSDYPLSKAIPKTLTTRVKLTIGTNGRVENCVVTSASRWPPLDPEVCRMLTAAHFRARGDSKGRPSVSTLDLDLEWTPPRIW